MVILLVALAAPAVADDAGEPPATFHKGQVGLSARFGVGVRGIAPHDGNKTYCGTTDSSQANGIAAVCTGRAPLAIGLEAAYGVARSIELLVELQVGIEKDFGSAPGVNDGPRALAISPGARFFFSEAKHSKLFVQPMLLLDVGGYKSATGDRGTEIGLRGLQGYWIDFHRTYGIYVYVGETIGFTPWLEGGIEGGFGIQGRYP